MDFPSQVSNLSEADYHSSAPLGSSDLKLILRSVAHFAYKKGSVHKETAAMIFGKALHKAILEPKRFDEDVAIQPIFSGKGSVLAREKWAIEHHGKIIIDEAEHEDLKAMVKSITNHKAASRLIVGGTSEESFFWQDSTTGLSCKCRPDYKRTDKILLDLKSTENASLEEFDRTILKYKYHLSAAHYLEGVSAVTGQAYETFLIIACEKTAPYLTQVFEIDFGALEKGRELCNRALLRYKNSQSLLKPPGYSEDVVPISIPPYGFMI